MNTEKMSNNQLMRYLIVVEKEIKLKQSEKKQIQDELNKRFEKGELGD